MAIEIPAAGSLRADVDQRSAQVGQWTTLDNAEMVVDGRFRLRSPFSIAGDASAPASTSFVSALSRGTAPWARAGGTFRFQKNPSSMSNPTLAVIAPPANVSVTGNYSLALVGSRVAHTSAVEVSSSYYRWIDICCIEYFGDDYVCSFGVIDSVNGTLVYNVVRAATGEVLYSGNISDATAFASATASLQVLPYGPSDLRVLIVSSVGTTAYAFRLNMADGSVSARRSWTVVALHPISTTGVRISGTSYLYVTTRDALASVVTRRWDTSTENVSTVITSTVTLGTSWCISTSAFEGLDGFPGFVECTCNVTNQGVIKRYGGASMTLATTRTTTATDVYRITAADSSGSGDLQYWRESSSRVLVEGFFSTTGVEYIYTIGIGSLETHAQLLDVVPDGLSGNTRVAFCGLTIGDTSETTREATVRFGASLTTRTCRGAVTRGLFGELQDYVTSATTFDPDKSLSHCGSFSSRGFCVSPAPRPSAVASRFPLLLVGSAYGLGALPDGTASAAEQGPITLHSGSLVYSDRSKLLPSLVSSVPYMTTTNLTTGGTLPAGSYGVAALYEWVDSSGQRWQSAPAVRTLVTTGATSSLYIVVPTMPGAQLAVYCTQAGGSTYYRRGYSVSGLTGYQFDILSSPAGDTEILYTAAEPPNLDPGHSQAVGVADSRYWAASGTRVYYSKRAEGGRAAQFAIGAFYLDCPERIYGIGELDEQPILLGAQRAYRVVGDGPDATGGGGVYLLQPIAGTPGAITTTPVLSSSVGVWYESTRGLTLLPRGGAPPVVQTAIQLSGLSSAVEDTAEERCLFATTGGILYAYDYRVGGWSRWSATALKLGSYAGVAMSSTGTRVYLQSPGDTSYADGTEAGSTASYTLVLETGDLRPAGTAAPVQWGTVSVLTGSVGTSSTLDTTIRSDTDAGTVTATSQSAPITADRQKVRVQPKYAAADAISLRWEMTPTGGQCADWCGATIEATPQGGTTRVPSGRSR